MFSVIKKFNLVAEHLVTAQYLNLIVSEFVQSLVCTLVRHTDLILQNIRTVRRQAF